jgi:hypothetical protein
VCLALLAPGVALAQGADGPWERGSVAVGFFAQSSQTDLRLNPSGAGLGVVIDLENTLGIGSGEYTFRVDAAVRSGERRRHEWDLRYFDFSRSGERTLGEDLEIGDELFPAGALVETDLDLRFITGEYTYAFLQDDRVRLAAGGGLYTLGIGFDVDAQGIGIAESTNFTAPLPVIALRGDFILTPRWQLHLDIDLFYVEYDAFVGSLSDTVLSVDFAPIRHMTLGFGINPVRLKLEGEGETDYVDFDGEMDLSFMGAQFYVAYRW